MFQGAITSIEGGSPGGTIAGIGPTIIPLCYVQTSGAAAWRLTYRWRLVCRTKYFMIDELLPVNDTNVWRIEPGSHSTPRRKLIQRTSEAGGQAIDLFESTGTITYGVRDPQAGGLGTIRVNSISDIAQFISTMDDVRLGGFV